MVGAENYLRTAGLRQGGRLEMQVSGACLHHVMCIQSWSFNQKNDANQTAPRVTDQIFPAGQQLVIILDEPELMIVGDPQTLSSVRT